MKLRQTINLIVLVALFLLPSHLTGQEKGPLSRFNEEQLKKLQASRAIRAVVKAIREILQQGGKVSLSGLGTFKVKGRKARKGRNPKTGEVIEIPAGRKISFKGSLSLKRLIK